MMKMIKRMDNSTRKDYTIETIIESDTWTGYWIKFSNNFSKGKIGFFISFPDNNTLPTIGVKYYGGGMNIEKNISLRVKIKDRTFIVLILDSDGDPPLVQIKEINKENK